MAGDLDFRGLVPEELPDGRAVLRDGIEHGRRIDRALSLFCETNGVRSEREYRERCRAEGQATTSINVGLNTWADTREALGCIIEDSRSRGVRPPDQFTLLAERRMGLPEDMRASAPQETGPCLWTEQDWWELTHSFCIQPGAEDNMIGGPGSFENVTRALQVGVTTVGVLSQYFWRWPYWDDDVAQTVAVVKAAGALAAWADDGACFNSYIDDGYPGVFHDYANLVGWTMVERYVSETLIRRSLFGELGRPHKRPHPQDRGDAGAPRDESEQGPAGLHARRHHRQRFRPRGQLRHDVDRRAVHEGDGHAVSHRRRGQSRTCHRSDSRPVLARDLGGPCSESPARRLRQMRSRASSTGARYDAKRDLLVEGGTRFFNALMGGMKRGGVDTEDPLSSYSR